MKPPLIGPWRITGMATIKRSHGRLGVPVWLRDNWRIATEAERTFYYAADGLYVTLVAHRSDPRTSHMWGIDSDHGGWHILADRCTLHPFTEADLAPKIEDPVDEDEEGTVNPCYGCGELITDDETIDVGGDNYCDDCAVGCADGYCDTVGLTEEDMHEIGYGYRSGWYCEDHAALCYSCGEWFRNDDLYDVWDENYCSGCTTFCDHCEARIPSGEQYCGDDCADAANGCDCEAPAQRFTIRNDGDDPLHQDQRVTISLPAGVISEEGMDRIGSYLANLSWTYVDNSDSARALRHLAARVADLGDRWQTKEGNFTKRLSRMAYKEFAFKVTPDMLSEIGNIATAHSKGNDYHVEVTRDLNLPPGDFCHEDSCWWQSYSESRCTLKNNGGFGLRTFSSAEEQAGYPTGRAWVLPLKKIADLGVARSRSLTPTFDTMDAAAFVVFNGYGLLDGYAPARIMAHMTGWTYRRIEFTADPMYVNCGGYLIAPEEIAKDFTDGHLSLSLADHTDLHYREQVIALAAKEKEKQHV